jgi:FAD/FMN-containing dehydrogenase
VAGYTLGGGLSFYAREHGLASDSVVAAEIVTADGSLVRADAANHSDLFWAVRGGGGNLGVVVALELRLLPMADVYAGMLLWDRERAPEVVRAWVEWTREVPDSVTTAMRVMSFPPLPELPPFLSGRQLVVIDGAVLETDERATELLAPLRALAPEMDTFGRIPVAGLTEIHMDPPGPTPAVSDHTMLAEVTEETIAALLAEVGPGTTTSLLLAELRHLGGALGRPAPDAGVLSHLTGAYSVFCVAIAPVPEAAVAGLADARRVVKALEPWATGTRYLNFSETSVDVASAFAPEALARLRRIRAAVDPNGVFQSNHAV